MNPGQEVSAEGAGALKQLRKIIHVDMDAFYASVEHAIIPSCGVSRWPLVAPESAGSWLRRAIRRAASGSIPPWLRSPRNGDVPKRSGMYQAHMPRMRL